MSLVLLLTNDDEGSQSRIDSIRESLCRCPGKKERLQLEHRVHQNERILPLFEREH